MVNSGPELFFEDIAYVGLGNVEGTITIEYEDRYGLDRKAVISTRGRTRATADPVYDCVTISGAGLHEGRYALTNDIQPCASQDSLGVNYDNAMVNCAGHTITRDSTGYAIRSQGTNITVANCNTMNGASGVYLAGDGHTLSSITIQNSEVSGVYVTDGSGGHTLSNITIENSAYGLQFHSSNGNTLNSVNVSGSSNAGIYFNNSNNNAINNSSLSGNSGRGIDMTNSNGNTLNRSAFNNNQYGIYAMGSSGNFTLDSEMNGNQFHGIMFDTASNNVFSGNSVQNNMLFGIRLNISTDTTLNNNIVCRNPGSDLSCSAASTASGSGNKADSSNCPGVGYSSC